MRKIGSQGTTTSLLDHTLTWIRYMDLVLKFIFLALYLELLHCTT